MQMLLAGAARPTRANLALACSQERLAIEQPKLRHPPPAAKAESLSRRLSPLGARAGASTISSSRLARGMTQVVPAISLAPSSFSPPLGAGRRRQALPALGVELKSGPARHCRYS